VVYKIDDQSAKNGTGFRGPPGEISEARLLQSIALRKKSLDVRLKIVPDALEGNSVG